MKTKKISLHLNNSGIPESNDRIGNKGFSLVELIVTIAIMAIFVAIVIISSSAIDSSRVKEVERGIDDYANMARSKSMSVSAKAWYMELTTVDGSYVAKLCKIEEIDEAGVIVDKVIEVDKDVYNNKVTVYFDDGTNSTLINKDAPLHVYFDSATGKVNKITIDGANVDISSGIGRVKITSESSSKATLKFFYNTGKIERE